MGDDERKEDQETEILGRLHAFYNARFLMQTPTELCSAPEIAFRTAGSVPFKWEEEPGKPKPCTDLAPYKPFPSLQLPPRLLYRCVADQPGPALSSRNHAAKLSSLPLRLSSCSPRILHDLCKLEQFKSLRQSFLPIGLSSSSFRGADSPKATCKKGEQDPSSPTSVLCGPEAGGGAPSSSSSTSSSSSSVTDGASLFSSGSSEVQSRPFSSEDDDVELAQLPQQKSGKGIASLSPPYPGLGPSDEDGGCSHLKKRALASVKNLLGRCGIGGKWSRNRRGLNRYCQETEMWAPTLATYFHSMELERESTTSVHLLMDKPFEEGAKMEHSRPQDLQCLALVCQGNEESQATEKEGPLEAEAACVDEAADAGGQGVSPSAISTPLRAAESGKKEKGQTRKKRVFKKLRNNSGLLVSEQIQSLRKLVHVAQAPVWRAVRRSLQNAKSKNGRLPYENLHL